MSIIETVDCMLLTQHENKVNKRERSYDHEV
jgi:hypothetical protein